jgi:radical SAM protein with 4Fe4S-binding SPASM domain
VKRYAAPLRLTWDWAWPPIAHPGASPARPSAETVRAVGAEIVRARVLLLEVGYPDAQALLAGELAAALAGFAGSLSLVLAPATAAALAGREPWSALGVEAVWLDATPGAGAIPAGLEAWPAQRFYLTAATVDAVAAGIERAVAAGATAISLPNLPLFGEMLRTAAVATPTMAQLSRLAGRVAAALHGRPAFDLRVHHYGLWQELRAAGVHPSGEESPGAGCQAGNALAYVDPAGVLYPCASLPVPLAAIREGAVAAAWAGETLAALRESIARLPAACVGCALEPTCRGGCRGWAHYLTTDWNATGPDCSRP